MSRRDNTCERPKSQRGNQSSKCDFASSASTELFFDKPRFILFIVTEGNCLRSAYYAFKFSKTSPVLQWSPSAFTVRGNLFPLCCGGPVWSDCSSIALRDLDKFVHMFGDLYVRLFLKICLHLMSAVCDGSTGDTGILFRNSRHTRNRCHMFSAL